MTSEKQKDFDAVHLMRSLRESISQETEGMSYEEEKAYIRDRVQEMRDRTEKSDQAENAA
jgi:hypothetical protein